MILTSLLPKAAVAAAVGLASLSAAVEPTLYPRVSPGLERPKGDIAQGPVGLKHEPLNPGTRKPNQSIDLRRSLLWGSEGNAHPGDRPLPQLPTAPPGRTKDNAELYPLNAIPVADGYWFVGGTVVGQQHRDLLWAYMKQLYDGDGLRFEATSRARVTVHGLRVDNMEDGVAPRLWGETEYDGVYWKVHQSYFRYIRDDVVENDSLIDGEITDCLVDGTFVFLSQRPGARSTRTRAETVTHIRDCLVHMQRMPYHRDIGGDIPAAGSIVDGKGHAQIFKMKGPASGRIKIQNTIFLVEGMSVNGPRSMDFPDWDGCSYENVIIVWLGGGTYPGKLPAKGVSVTHEIAVWRKARAAWLAAHPGATEGL